MNIQLVTIKEASEMLAVSTDTLRNWDEKGILKSFRATPTSKRLYRIEDLQNFIKQGNANQNDDLENIAKEWTSSGLPIDISKEFHCQTKDIFEARYRRLLNELPSKLAHILTAITSEIGNNSYDHNIGKWEDIAGIFFAHDIKNKKIIIADRGRGILTTLKNVKPKLSNHKDALHTAFTEIISGRAPETRGNGLKFVKKTILNYPFSIYFKTGDAVLSIGQVDKKLEMKKDQTLIRGCFTIINY